MNKPHWEQKHDWAIANVRFELEEIWAFKKMLRKHPDDSFGEMLRECIKGLKKRLELVIGKYEKIYGDKPDVRELRREVEKNI